MRGEKTHRYRKVKQKEQLKPISKHNKTRTAVLHELKCKGYEGRQLYDLLESIMQEIATRGGRCKE